MKKPVQTRVYSYPKKVGLFRKLLMVISNCSPAVKWVGSVFGLLGLIFALIIGGIIPIKPSNAHLPDYAAIVSHRANWTQYQKITEGLDTLDKDWFRNHRNWKPPNDQFEQQIARESLSSQTSQIKSMFVGEETFRRIGLEEALKLFNTQLHQDIEQRISIKSGVLRKKLDEDLGFKGREHEKAMADYNQELVNDYQVTLTNLQLQLLLTDLFNNTKDPVEEKKRIQNQINHIHQEMHEKISIRQQQLNAELEVYKKQRQKETESELEMLRGQWEAYAVEELRKYGQTLEEGFQNWLEQRQRETQSAIDQRMNF